MADGRRGTGNRQAAAAPRLRRGRHAEFSRAKCRGSAGAGRAHTRTRLGRGARALVWVSTVLVAVSVVLVAGCGGSKHTTTSTSTSTLITRSTTRTPVTATTVRVFAPADKVTARTAGSCLEQSRLVSRPGVWRCVVGSQVRDPCFVHGARAVVCPLGGPWGSSVLLISLPGSLPRVSVGRPAGAVAPPWAIELGDGSRCTLLSGAGRVSYACDTEEELLGRPDRRHRVWTIPAGSGSAPAVRPTAIRVAWFAPRLSTACAPPRRRARRHRAARCGPRSCRSSHR